MDLFWVMALNQKLKCLPITILTLFKNLVSFPLSLFFLLTQQATSYLPDCKEIKTPVKSF